MNEIAPIPPMPDPAMLPALAVSLGGLGIG